MEFSHIPVLLNETLDGLNILPGGIYVDGTAGGAGHSREIARRLTTGRLIALDQDPDAIATATERLKGFPAVVIKSNFRNMREALDLAGIDLVDGIMLDIGVSSFQLDNRERGFSFHDDAQLDMRMSKEGTTAADLVNNLEVSELTKILRDYGEEKFAYKIVIKIADERKKAEITTTGQLAQIIASAVPAAVRRQGNPSRKSFQALRIAVNDELGALKDGIDAAWKCLKPGGRLAIITFHSLEDRIVKQKFKEYSTGCTCPPDIPICICGKTPEGRLITSKPVTASEEELEKNARSRSAKLRVIEKL